MRVIEHFSVYTKLPIKLADVSSYIVDAGYTLSIRLFPTDCDPHVLAGMLRLCEHVAPYATAAAGETHADIIYSTRMSPASQRLTIAKELLHICDPEHVRAKTPEQVSRLIKEFNYPADVLAELGKVSTQLISDRFGILQAIALLLPEEAIDDLRPAYMTQRLGDEEVAALAEIPEFAVKLAMSDDWPTVLKAFKTQKS